MPGCLLIHSTVDGHTLTISRRLGQRLADEHGLAVRLMSVDEALSLPDLEAAATPQAIVLGASIRYGHHRPAVHEFVRRHRDGLLARCPSAFFSVCAVARKPGKDRPDTNPYARRFLRDTAWTPALAAVFGGRIDYRLYGWRDRLVIRLIMWLTHGPTDPQVAVEFTDWARVDQFADELADHLGVMRCGALRLRLRRAVPADAAACITLRGQTRDNAIPPAVLAARGITPESWAAMTARGEVQGWVAEALDPASGAGLPRLLGFAAGAPAHGEVPVLAVHADADGQGLGRALLARVVEDLGQAGHQRLHLATTTDPAQRAHGFYRHLGWQPTGVLDAQGDERLEWPVGPRGEPAGPVTGA